MSCWGTVRRQAFLSGQPSCHLWVASISIQLPLRDCFSLSPTKLGSTRLTSFPEATGMKVVQAQLPLVSPATWAQVHHALPSFCHHAAAKFKQMSPGVDFPCNESCYIGLLHDVLLLEASGFSKAKCQRPGPPTHCPQGLACYCWSEPFFHATPVLPSPPPHPQLLGLRIDPSVSDLGREGMLIPKCGLAEASS